MFIPLFPGFLYIQAVVIHQPYGPWFHQALRSCLEAGFGVGNSKGESHWLQCCYGWMWRRQGKVGVGQDLYGKVVIYVHMYTLAGQELCFLSRPTANPFPLESF